MELLRHAAVIGLLLLLLPALELMPLKIGSFVDRHAIHTNYIHEERIWQIVIQHDIFILKMSQTTVNCFRTSLDPVYRLHPGDGDVYIIYRKTQVRIIKTEVKSIVGGRNMTAWTICESDTNTTFTLIQYTSGQNNLTIQMKQLNNVISQIRLGNEYPLAVIGFFGYKMFPLEELKLLNFPGAYTNARKMKDSAMLFGTMKRSLLPESLHVFNFAMKKFGLRQPFGFTIETILLRTPARSPSGANAVEGPQPHAVGLSRTQFPSPIHLSNSGFELIQIRNPLTLNFGQTIVHQSGASTSGDDNIYLPNSRKGITQGLTGSIRRFKPYNSEYSERARRNRDPEEYISDATETSRTTVPQLPLHDPMTLFPPQPHAHQHSSGLPGQQSQEAVDRWPPVHTRGVQLPTHHDARHTERTGQYGNGDSYHNLHGRMRIPVHPPTTLATGAGVISQEYDRGRRVNGPYARLPTYRDARRNQHTGPYDNGGSNQNMFGGMMIPEIPHTTLATGRLTLRNSPDVSLRAQEYGRNRAARLHDPDTRLSASPHTRDTAPGRYDDGESHHTLYRAPAGLRSLADDPPAAMPITQNMLHQALTRQGAPSAHIYHQAHTTYPSEPVITSGNIDFGFDPDELGQQMADHFTSITTDQLLHSDTTSPTTYHDSSAHGDDTSDDFLDPSSPPHPISAALSDGYYGGAAEYFQQSPVTIATNRGARSPSPLPVDVRMTTNLPQPHVHDHNHGQLNQYRLQQPVPRPLVNPTHDGYVREEQRDAGDPKEFYMDFE